MLGQLLLIFLLLPSELFFYLINSTIVLSQLFFETLFKVFVAGDLFFRVLKIKFNSLQSDGEPFDRVIDQQQPDESDSSSH